MGFYSTGTVSMPVHVVLIDRIKIAFASISDATNTSVSTFEYYSFFCLYIASRYVFRVFGPVLNIATHFSFQNRKKKEKWGKKEKQEPNKLGRVF